MTPEDSIRPKTRTKGQTPKELAPSPCLKRSKPSNSKPKMSAEETAFMRGFGAALASIWHCHHDGQRVQHLIKENNFKLSSFEGIGLLDADLGAIRQALQRGVGVSSLKPSAPRGSARGAPKRKKP